MAKGLSSIPGGHYKLVLSKGSISVEISSHEKEWVEKKEKEYKSFLNQPVTEEDVLTPPRRTEPAEKTVSVPPGTTVVEFYRKYIRGKIKTRSEIATFFVYYLSKVLKQEEVTSNDVRNQFKTVGYPGRSNINVVPDALMKAKNKALLNSDGNQWTLTLTGEDFVLNNLLDQNA